MEQQTKEALVFAVGAYAVSELLFDPSSGGDNVLLYQTHATGAGELRNVARSLGRMIGAEAVAVRTPHDALGAVRGHQKIRRLVIHGHGSSRGLLITSGTGFRAGRDRAPSYASTRTLARELAPRLVRGFVIGLNSCSTGSDPGSGGWAGRPYSSGGARSFAAGLRDELVAAGAPTGKVLAFAARGTHGNPSGRSYHVDRRHVGQPGLSWMEESWGAGAARNPELVSQWGSAARGDRGFRWIIGEPVNIPRPALA